MVNLSPIEYSWHRKYASINETVISEPEAAPGHRLGPSRRTGGVDGGRPVAHVSGLPSSLGMDNVLHWLGTQPIYIGRL